MRGKTWKRRLLAGALALVVTAGLLPTVALAEEGNATGGTITGETTAEQVTEYFGGADTVAVVDGTITLKQDVTVDAPIDFTGGTWTLNMAGHTMTSVALNVESPTAPLQVSGTTTTLTLTGNGTLQGYGSGNTCGILVSNGTLKVEGEITAIGMVGGIRMTGGSLTATAVTTEGIMGAGIYMDGGSLTAITITAKSTYGYGIILANDARLEAATVTAEGTGDGIIFLPNNSASLTATTVTAESTESYGIYMDNGTLTARDIRATGGDSGEGICIAGGTVTMTGGDPSITAFGGDSPYVYNGDGIFITGGGSIKTDSTATGTLTITATGGKAGPGNDMQNPQNGHGIRIKGNSPIDAGSISLVIEATGGEGNDRADGGDGIRIEDGGGSISGSGAVTITATGGNASGDKKGGSGIAVTNLNQLPENAKLTVAGGEPGGAAFKSDSGRPSDHYIVTFNATGGAPQPGGQLVKHGEKANEPTGLTKDGYKLLGWYSNDQQWNFNISEVTGDTNLTAEWAQLYAVSVTSGTGGGEFIEGETVSITAGTPPAGQRFSQWTASPGVSFANANSASTSFTMIGEAVTVTANFEPIPPNTYPVTVSGGTADKASAAQGVTVSITADAPPAGQRFSHWTASPGVTFANANSASTSFTMIGEAVTVTAHFENIPTPPSGGDDSEPTYRPDVEDSQGGDVTVTPRNPERGDTVTITPKPDRGYEVDEVIVTDRKGDPVEVTRREDGTYTFRQPRGRVTIKVTYKPVETAWVNPFIDVAPGDWCYDAVEYVQKNGLMAGTSATTFSPNAATSRGMIVTILWRMAGSPNLEDEIWGYPFADVDSTAYYGTAVYWARLNGIANGYGDEAFGPNDPISREQLAVMLYNYAGRPPVANLALMFSDTDQVSGFADSAMRWAVEQGILSGKGGGILDPKGQATRAEVAVMLMRFCENIQ